MFFSFVSIEANRDVLVGIKVALSRSWAGSYPGTTLPYLDIPLSFSAFPDLSLPFLELSLPFLKFSLPLPRDLPHFRVRLSDFSSLEPPTDSGGRLVHSR